MSRSFRCFGIALLLVAVALFGPVVFGQEEPPEEPPAAPPAVPPAAPPAQPPAATSAPAPVTKAVIELGNKAKGNGEIVFAFTPTGGAAMEIRVTVADKMNASEVAKDIAKEFTVAIGANYEAKGDGSKVTIQGKKKATFGLSIASQAITGLSIRIK